MMEVQVFINGKLVASADATNVSALADVSDYECWGTEKPSKITDGFAYIKFKIEGHKRQQTCWALVQKMAAALVDQQLSREVK